MKEGTEIELKSNPEHADDNYNGSSVLLYLQMQKLIVKVNNLEADIEAKIGKVRDELISKIDDNRRQTLSAIAHSQTESLRITENALTSVRRDVTEAIKSNQTEIVKAVSQALEQIGDSERGNSDDSSGQRNSHQSTAENSFISFISQSQNTISEDAQAVLAANLISFSPGVDSEPMVNKKECDSLTLDENETASGLNFESESRLEQEIPGPTSREAVVSSKSYQGFQTDFNAARDVKSFLDDSQFLDCAVGVSTIDKDTIKMQLDDLMKNDSPIVFKTGRSKSISSLKNANAAPSSSDRDRKLGDVQSSSGSHSNSAPDISKHFDSLSLDFRNSNGICGKLDMVSDTERRHSLSTSQAEYTKLDSPFKVNRGSFEGYTVLEGSNEELTNKENTTNLDETVGENVFSKKIIRDSLGYRKSGTSSSNVLQSSSCHNTENSSAVFNPKSLPNSSGVKTPANSKVQGNRKSMLQGLSIMSPIEDEGSFESCQSSRSCSSVGYTSSDSVCSVSNLSEAKNVGKL